MDDQELLDHPLPRPDWEEPIDYMDDVDFFRSDLPSLAGQLWASRTQAGNLVPWYNTISEPEGEVPSDFLGEEEAYLHADDALSVSTDFTDSVITDFSETVEDEARLGPESPTGPGSSPTHSIDTLLDPERPTGPGSPTHSVDTLLDPERPTGPGSPTHSIDTLPDEDVCYVVRRDKAVSLLTPVSLLTSDPRTKVVPKRKNYYCEECGKGYTHRSGLSRHKNIHLERYHECPKCEAKLTRSDSLTDHMRRHHKV